MSSRPTSTLCSASAEVRIRRPFVEIKIHASTPAVTSSEVDPNLGSYAAPSTITPHVRAPHSQPHGRSGSPTGAGSPATIASPFGASFEDLARPGRHLGPRPRPCHGHNGVRPPPLSPDAADPASADDGYPGVGCPPRLDLQQFAWSVSFVVATWHGHEQARRGTVLVGMQGLGVTC